MGLLRLLLAISVVGAHMGKIFGFGFVSGTLAVQSFFMISGFYMTLVLNEKYTGIRKSYKLFISSRLLRLFPVYWVVVLLEIVVTGSKQDIYVDNYDVMNIGTLLFLIGTNILVFFQDIVMFLGYDLSTGELFFTKNFRDVNLPLYKFLLVPQAWSIGLELTFYLIAPFVVRWKISIIYGFIALSVLLRVILYNIGYDNDPWTYRFFPTELVFFLLGAVAYHRYKKLEMLKFNRTYLYIVFSTLILFTCVYSFISISFIYYIYLVFFFLSIPYVFILSKNWKVDRYIGELSYPIYISHMFVLHCIYVFGLPIIGDKGFTVMTISILFSVLLNTLVAEKIEKFRQRRIMKTV